MGCGCAGCGCAGCADCGCADCGCARDSHSVQQQTVNHRVSAVRRSPCSLSRGSKVPFCYPLNHRHIFRRSWRRSHPCQGHLQVAVCMHQRIAKLLVLWEAKGVAGTGVATTEAGKESVRRGVELEVEELAAPEVAVVAAAAHAQLLAWSLWHSPL